MKMFLVIIICLSCFSCGVTQEEYDFIVDGAYTSCAAKYKSYCCAEKCTLASSFGDRNWYECAQACHQRILDDYKECTKAINTSLDKEE